AWSGGACGADRVRVSRRTPEEPRVQHGRVALAVPTGCGCPAEYRRNRERSIRVVPPVVRSASAGVVGRVGGGGEQSVVDDVGGHEYLVVGCPGGCRFRRGGSGLRRP